MNFQVSLGVNIYHMNFQVSLGVSVLFNLNEALIMQWNRNVVQIEFITLRNKKRQRSNGIIGVSRDYSICSKIDFVDFSFTRFAFVQHENNNLRLWWKNMNERNHFSTESNTLSHASFFIFCERYQGYRQCLATITMNLTQNFRNEQQ